VNRSSIIGGSPSRFDETPAARCASSWSPCINGVIKATPWAAAAVRWRTEEALHLLDVALATCSLLPYLDADERSLIPALEACGVVAEPRVWDDPSVRWDDFRLIVIRSAWDYAERRDDFLEWCAGVPHVLNSVPVVTWNTDKSYLRSLAAAGVPTVPTTWIDSDSLGSDIPLPKGHLVVKPSVSSGAQNSCRYRPGDHAAARMHVERLLTDGRVVMVQPYVASVDADGETGLIYIDGVFSHAIRKGALLRAPGVATDQLWAVEDITPRVPDVDERAVAEATLDALPWPRDALLYARVDLVRGGDGAPLLLELELAEPSLFLGLGSGSASRLASAIAWRLGHD
jgi:glutathione synthase/RimK-type ligase-like ATP-grasp enzyme